MLEQTILGALDLVIPTEPAIAKYANKFNLVGAPFAFKDYAATDRFFAGDFLKWVTPDLEKAGLQVPGPVGVRLPHLHHLQAADQHARGLQGAEDPHAAGLREPGDGQGARAASPRPSRSRSCAMALKQGVVDGQENPIATIYSNKMWETQKYLSMLNYTYNSTHLLMGKAAFDRLTAAQQQVLIEEGDEGRTRDAEVRARHGGHPDRRD